ncbi:MAG: hypothetical protein QY309_13415 [Cyclobacteriaceae bacterium]|nr:MAG: hypothetical protein QY309_13415 [Cyclobacteriaceae bacterium]
MVTWDNEAFQSPTTAQTQTLAARQDKKMKDLGQVNDRQIIYINTKTEEWKRTYRQAIGLQWEEH